MKLTHLGNGIVLVRNLVEISYDDISEINHIFDSTTPQGYSVVDGKTISDGGYEFDEIGRSKSPTRYTNIGEFDITKKLRESMYSAVVEYCKVFPVALECITGQTDGYMIRYGHGSDMGPHSDCNLPYKPGTLEPMTSSPAFNTLTTSIFLNDGYTGGEVTFRMWGITVKPEAGTAIIYPSNFIGCHEVSEVSDGERWAFLSWFFHGNGQESKEGSYEWSQQLKQKVGIGNIFQKNILIGDVS
jgi:hypothetical protein